jgi:hypothetical protein
MLQTSLIDFIISLENLAWVPAVCDFVWNTSNMATGTSLICLAVVD